MSEYCNHKKSNGPDVWRAYGSRSLHPWGSLGCLLVAFRLVGSIDESWKNGGQKIMAQSSLLYSMATGSLLPHCSWEWLNRLEDGQALFFFILRWMKRKNVSSLKEEEEEEERYFYSSIIVPCWGLKQQGGRKFGLVPLEKDIKSIQWYIL